MISLLKNYSSHITYWAAIFAVTIVLGTLLGTTGVNRLKSMPKLTLIDVDSKVQIQQMVEKNDRKITNLDNRMTVIELKLEKHAHAK